MKKYKGVSLSEITESVEKSVLGWIRARKHRLPVFILLVVALLTLYHAPYINLILNSYLIIFLTVVFSPIVLDIDSKVFFICALVLIFPALLFSLGMHQREEAEIIGEYIFILLSAGLTRLILSSY